MHYRLIIVLDCEFLMYDGIRFDCYVPAF